MTEWLDEAEQRAWRAYVTMQMRLNAHLARDLQANTDLSMADFGVLVALTDVCQGRVRAFELAEALQWEKSRLSHHLARMAKRGLITRDGCTEDGRGQFVARHRRRPRGDRGGRAAPRRHRPPGGLRRPHPRAGGRSRRHRRTGARHASRPKAPAPAPEWNSPYPKGLGVPPPRD